MTQQHIEDIKKELEKQVEEIWDGVGDTYVPADSNSFLAWQKAVIKTAELIESKLEQYANQKLVEFEVWLDVQGLIRDLDFGRPKDKFTKRFLTESKQTEQEVR